MSARTNLVLDLAIAAAFLFASNPPVAGLTVHEWFGLAFGAVIIVHVVLHWEWSVHVTRRLFGGRGGEPALNYAVDAILFVALTASVLSGLLTSRHVLPWFGLPAEPARGWREIHSFAANTSVVAIGVHLGLHWNWLAFHLPRLAGRGAKAAGGGTANARRPLVADAVK
jgi:hypothetical protein